MQEPFQHMLGRDSFLHGFEAPSLTDRFDQKMGLDKNRDKVGTDFI
jgi:hypothetical protein